MKTIYEMNLDEIFGYKEIAGCMTLEELEEITSGIYSYKEFYIAFGFPQHIDGQTFQTVRVWQRCGSNCDGEWVVLKFQAEHLCAGDMQATRLAIKWAKMHIDEMTK